MNLSMPVAHCALRMPRGVRWLLCCLTCNLLLLLTTRDACCDGSLTTLYTFGSSASLGMSPQAPLSAPLDGVFYGATYYGGTSNSGTLFKITTNGLITTLYSFSGGNDGGNPFGGLVLASDHNFYGTTVYGGTNGFGTCFKLAGDGTFTPLYSFTGNADGGNPYAGLTQGKDGNLYGTTYNGGQGYGTVFRITIQGAITPFYSFTGNTSDGANPSGKLVQGSDGNFYGT